ncbi:MAG: ATP-binding cassette domain-containing protein, partial [Oscillospiraceae bacterium]|nr:ATP-binding cassette domain-containing protein [Oscillospiraceae bacterium]
IGFIFQSFNLISSLSAFENVQLPLVYREMPLKNQRERVHNALLAVGMQGRARHLPSQLSGGQQQRVAVARALAGNPNVILADEPTGNLDRKNSLEVLSILRNLSQNSKTVVMVTHDNSIAQAADRIIRITDGEIDY